MEHLLRLPEVERLTGLKRSAIYQRIERGQFPRPIHVTEKAVAWVGSEINHWIHSTIAADRREVA